ncbi:MAG: ankyrin repeat domain-containing protein, partial [Planctomycetota bacterium]|nr:ankyrin repeat domain-containing protein [Planctomycetota bacterium]
ARLLLDAGADVNADAGSGPPIYHAVRRGHAGVVELLIERRADPSVRSVTGNTLLYEVAGSTHADVAETLLRAGADPNELNGSGDPPLIAASIRGDVRIVRALLKAGAKVDPPAPTPKMMTNPTMRMFTTDGNKTFSSPLVHAAEIGHLEVVRALVKAGADVKRKDGHGHTAYDAARRENHREIALLLKDADPRVAKPVDIFMAAEAGDVKGIRAALAAGTKVDAKSGLSERGLGSVMKGTKPKDVLGTFLGAFASLNKDFLEAVGNDADEQRESAAWHHGMTALMIAAKHGHVDAVRVLLDAGATVDERSSDPPHSGYKALHYASAAGHVEVMRLLLDAGADVSDQAVDLLGEPTCTPLHLAAGEGHAAAAHLLIERGADASDDTGGDTPLDRASRGGHTGVARLLKTAGASAIAKRPRRAAAAKQAKQAKKTTKAQPPVRKAKRR